jgi:hypothetical protein
MAKWIKIKDDGFQDVLVDLDKAIGCDFLTDPNFQTETKCGFSIMFPHTQYTFEFLKTNSLLHYLRKYFEDKLNA